MSDPLRELGLGPHASADDVRRARRELAKAAHPDAGGDAERMQAVNAAAAAALRLLAASSGVADAGPVDRHSDAAPSGRRPSDDGRRPWLDARFGDGRRRDMPSFTVEALPVETFEGLLVAAATLGEVVDDDPPYELTVAVELRTVTPSTGEAPESAASTSTVRCWCRLQIVPDAGASTVGLEVAPMEGGGALPPVDVVRDVWIAELNRIDWSQL